MRAIRKMAHESMAGTDKLIESIYATTGRSSIPPEKLLKAQLLIILYSIRSNRQLVEQIHYNFLFRWFLGMGNEKIAWQLDLHAAAYNLVRMKNLGLGTT